MLRDRAQQADGAPFDAAPRYIIEFFLRKDVLAANGLPIDQPQSDELIQRMVDLHAKTIPPAITI
jgi:hypothetical protein